MDPIGAVGLAASAAQLATLAGAVLTNLYQYCRNVAMAPKYSEQLRRELGIVCDLLVDLQMVFEANVHRLSRPSLNTEFQDFNEILQELMRRTTPKQTKGKERLMWPLRQDENARFLSRIERFKSSYSLLLNIIQAYTQPSQYNNLIAKFARQALQDIHGNIIKITNQGHEFRRDLLYEKLMRLLNDICSTHVNPAKEQHIRKSLLTPNTGLWIFETLEYISWERSPTSLLWLNGQMGAGKTILTYEPAPAALTIPISSSIIDKLESTTTSNSALTLVGIAFSYCDSDSTESLGSFKIFASLLKQLVLQSASLAGCQQLEALIERYRGTLVPSMELLITELEWISHSFCSVYIIVDGLDECMERDTIPASLQRLSKRAKVLVTSRPEVDIKFAFVGERSINVDKAVRNDICIHVQWQTEVNQKLCYIRPSLKRKIQEDLIAKSGGMFRWVQCQLDYITSLRQDAARREALNCLPPGLPATYACMLERIGRVPHDLKIARAALTWLIFSRRPLKLRELSVAAVLEADTEFDDEQLLDSEKTLIEICGSLIKFHEDTQIVTFGHFSVQEFLTLPVLPDGTANIYFTSESEGNELLMKSSFSYLQSSVLRRVAQLVKPKPPGWLHLCTTVAEIKQLHADSFLTYAMFNWPFHSQNLVDKVSTSNRILSFFKSNSFAAWSQLWVHSEEIGRWYIRDREARLRHFGSRVETPATPLYFAAMFGFDRVASVLLDEEPNVNVRGGLYDYPIFVAIVNENHDVLRALLAKGADTRVRRTSDEGISGETPLHMAASLWSLDIVRLLTDWKADVNAQTGTGSTPLCEALSEHGDQPVPELVRLLLPDPDILMMKPCDSPLHVASQYAQIRSARIILETHGHAYVNTPNENQNTPLQEAVRRGSKRMVSLLLEFGANVMARGQYGWTPLQLAVWDGNIAMMEYLGNFSVRNLPHTNWSLCKPPLPGPKPLPGHNRVQSNWIKEPLSERYLALRHLLLINPSDHIWRLFFAEYCFRHGNMELALPLHEQALCLDPRNSYIVSIKEVFHSVPCWNCEREIRGDLYKCVRNSCWANICKDCLSKKDCRGCGEARGIRGIAHQFQFQWDSTCWLPRIAQTKMSLDYK